MRDEPVPAVCDIWPENIPVVDVFLQLATQWRIAAGMGGAIWLGLDYPAVAATFDLLGITDRKRLFSDLRVMESAALPELNR